MPVVLLERVPLPSLTTYTSVSAMLLGVVIYHSHCIVTDQNITEHYNRESIYDKDLSKFSSEGIDFDQAYQTDHESDGYLVDLCAAMLQETWSIWILVNTAYCCLLMFGKLIQRIVFGELRVGEQQQLKDKFWNFIFYKFIFVFGVMNVQTMEEVALWCAWFSLLGFLHLLAQLCKDRFQYLCSSPATPMKTHAKVLLLLLGIELACVCLLGICIIVGLLFSGMNTFAFMAAECILLVIKSFHVIVRYFIHLWDSAHEGIWENRALYVYYSELVFELCALGVDFVHHLHMLLWGNIFLSMASLVIFMQLRFLFYEFQRRYKRHKNYLQVVNSMESRFPMASKKRLEECNENCAICWEKLESARTLPCGHLFHNSCLRSWLEQDTTCPTCRKSLADPNERQVYANPGPAGDMQTPIPGIPAPNQNSQQLYNHFFHFDGSRYVSWLPSFSVEVTHTTLLGERNTAPASQNSQMDNMVRQVREVFPDVPSAVVLEDLHITKSVQLTLENIIEGNIGVPQPLQRSLITNADGSLSASRSDIQSNYTGNLQTLHTEVKDTKTRLPVESEKLVTASENDLYSNESILYNPELHEDEDARIYLQRQSSNSEINDFAGRNLSVNEEVDFNSIYDDNLPVLNLLDKELNIASETRDDSIHQNGYRFSKSSSERSSMLQERKQSLLEQARRHYLTSHDKENYSGLEEVKEKGKIEQTSKNSTVVSELQRKRDLAYEAARRRFQQS